MNSHLFLVNIPCGCTDGDVREWIESFGMETLAVRIVRDMVAGASPSFGYVELKDPRLVKHAIGLMDGQKMGDQTIMVRETPAQPAVWAPA